MATEILANLLESGALSEEAGAQIKEALETKLNEAREEITPSCVRSSHKSLNTTNQ